ncbi:CLUMA_CG014819, isoform A [Clunio marinus]|uniref:CLUMA_CG014819, isoform A n=1 Tax=Clunio marinus TaxID=568069 RepID=A0A1J1IPN6_9DIPT|nr:CLUMA_CG014819, isoform A [Clunio marinus]
MFPDMSTFYCVVALNLKIHHLVESKECKMKDILATMHAQSHLLSHGVQINFTKIIPHNFQELFKT